MSIEIAKQWLSNCAETVAEKNLTVHMNLISKSVSLQGIPGFDEITYGDWEKQCQHEFENNIIKRVSYDDIKMISNTATHVMFKTFETVESVDGSVNSQEIEVLLEKEGDGQWRLIQERILPVAETKHDGLLN